LLAMNNVVTTPHLGSAVDEVREQMANIVVENVLALIAGRRPPNCVNPQVLDVTNHAAPADCRH
jgi:lactate dehydrogenase-like 2-hydroxyacid dehydrogenase